MFSKIKNWLSKNDEDIEMQVQLPKDEEANSAWW